MSMSCKQIDDTFGPYAQGCRGGFDITLLFQDSILSILPLGLLLIVIPFRISYLFRRKIKVDPSSWLALKLVSNSTQRCISPRAHVHNTDLKPYRYRSCTQFLERYSLLSLHCGQSLRPPRPRRRLRMLSLPQSVLLHWQFFPSWSTSDPFDHP